MEAMTGGTLMSSSVSQSHGDVRHLGGRGRGLRAICAIRLLVNGRDYLYGQCNT